MSTSDASAGPQPMDQHDIEIHENAVAWDRKPALRRAYAKFYRDIQKWVRRSESGLVLELGSGLGKIKTAIPDCVTSDLFPNPWLDRRENAYALSCAPHSVATLILFDVWHHLQHPASAMREFERVLEPSGRLILFEPAMGLLGRFVFGLFHHEPLGGTEPVAWHAPPDFSPEHHPYYAAQANCWTMFRKRRVPPELGPWRIVDLSMFPAFSYLVSGGFRGPQLAPGWMLPILDFMERPAGLIPDLFATRMLVILEKIR